LPAVDLDNEKATQIVAGWRHSCALLGNGEVRCWGRNMFGQLGLGHIHDIGDDPGETPKRVQIDGSAVMIAAGGEFACALMDNDALRCWGENESGQLGLGPMKKIGDDEFPSTVDNIPY